MNTKEFNSEAELRELFMCIYLRIDTILDIKLLNSDYEKLSNNS